jgi:hypothetical protein
MFITSDALPLGSALTSFTHAREGNTEQACGSLQRENMMIKFGFTGAAVLSLALVIGATASQAQAADGHQYRRHLHAAPPPVVAYEPNLPIENALRWGYSQGYSNYPSGFGGLYGDGRYPENTVSGPHTYNTLR